MCRWERQTPAAVGEQFPDVGGSFGKAVGVDCRMEFPVGMQVETALHIVAAVRRLDFPDRPEHAVARCASRSQKQQVCHAVLVDLVGNIRVLKQCLDL